MEFSSNILKAVRIQNLLSLLFDSLSFVLVVMGKKGGRAAEGMSSVVGESTTENSRLTTGEKQPRKSVFTPAQFQELQKQFLIFHYLLNGLQIPSHLVASVRENVFTSNRSGCPGIYQHCPGCKYILIIIDYFNWV